MTMSKEDFDRLWARSKEYRKLLAEEGEIACGLEVALGEEGHETEQKPVQEEM